MNIEDIEEIAKETGVGSLYPRPRLQDMGDGTMKFVSSGVLTYFGVNLIEFANAIEKRLSEEYDRAMPDKDAEE